MWSQIEQNDDIPLAKPPRETLLRARQHMTRALALLDSHSASAAAASLDMALHQLDRDLSG